MDKLLSTLLSTPWGRSFIGGTYIVWFMAMVGVGWAYLDLLDDYQGCELRLNEELKAQAVREEARWLDRIAELKALHARQDSIMINQTQKRKRK